MLPGTAGSTVGPPCEERRNGRTGGRWLLVLQRDDGVLHAGAGPQRVGSRSPAAHAGRARTPDPRAGPIVPTRLPLGDAEPTDDAGVAAQDDLPRPRGGRMRVGVGHALEAGYG